MTGRTPRWVSKLAALSSILFGASVLVVACDTDNGNPTSPPITIGSGGSVGNGGSAAEVCEDGDVRGCKVDLDELNCFEGEQTCVGNEWGPCEEGTGTLALGGNAPCPSNPCNPGCQEYEETPGTPLSPPATTPPASAVGDPTSLPTTWQDAAFNDNNHAQGSDCSSTGSCQLDHYCQDITAPQNCEPWGGENGNWDFDPNDNWNLTIDMVCDPDNITVCNRGGTAAPGGLALTVWDPNPDYMSWNGNGACTNLESLGTYHGSCLMPASTLAPGACVTVTGCGSVIAGTDKAITVNTPDQANAPWNLPYDSNEEECTDNWSVFIASASCSCSSVTQQGALTPVDLYLILDSSGSMNNGTPDKWDASRGAVTTFLQSSASDNLSLAMRLYGDTPVSGCDNSSCSSNACSQPAVPLGLLGPGVTGTETAAVTATNAFANAPGGVGTPHEPVLGGLALWGTNQAIAEPTHTVANVYITDGQYGGCSTNTANNVAPLATAFGTYGVRTYIVALPGISNTVFTDFVTPVATAGGTAPIDLRSSGASIGTDLTNELVGIQNNLASCNITIPNPNDVDPNNIAAEYLPNGMAPGTMLTQVTNAGACSGGNEFYLDNNTTPTEVILCPALCGTVQADTNGIVDIVGACLLSTTVTTQVFDYEGTCPGGQGPQWDFLEYDTTINGNALVDFNVGTGNSVAEAVAAPDVFIAQADTANPDAPGGSPADLGGPLGLTAQYATHLQLRITMTPDGANLPFVNSWNVSYTCVDNI